MYLDALAALGLDDTARVADVKDNFRMLAWTAHPDHGGTREKFDALMNAYREALEWAQHVPCEACAGTGRTQKVDAQLHVVSKPCGTCAGAGLRG